MEKVTHTPLPWVLKPGVVLDGNGENYGNVIAYTFDDLIHRDSEECRANAAFIVKCVNNHYQLLEAAQAALDYLTGNTPPDNQRSKLEAAIKQARG